MICWNQVRLKHSMRPERPLLAWHGPVSIGVGLDRVARVEYCPELAEPSQRGPIRYVRMRPWIRTLRSRPDLLIVHSGGPEIPVDLHEIAIPKLLVLWDPDAVWAHGREYARLFDLVVTIQKDYAERIRREVGTPAHWIPVGADPPYPLSTLPLRLEARPIDVAFVGARGRMYDEGRDRFLGELQAALGPGIKQEIGPGDWKQVYPRAKVVVNFNQRGELNQRTFEAMACGSVVVTPEPCPGLRDLFIPGHHLLTYPAGDAGRAAEVARQILGDLPSAQRLASRGMLEVWERHRPAHRTHRLADVILEYLAGRPGPRQCRTDPLALARHLLWFALAPGAMAQAEWDERVRTGLRLASDLLRTATVAGSPDCEAHFLSACLAVARGNGPAAEAELRAVLSCPILRPEADRALRALNTDIAASAAGPLTPPGSPEHGPGRCCLTPDHLGELFERIAKGEHLLSGVRGALLQEILSGGIAPDAIPPDRLALIEQHLRAALRNG